MNQPLTEEKQKIVKLPSSREQESKHVQPLAISISTKKHCLKHNEVLSETKLNASVASVTVYNQNSTSTSGETEGRK